MEENRLTSRLRKLLVIGGSAGSLAIILKIIPLLTMDMELCVLIVMHRMTSTEDGVLPEVIAGRTPFEVREIEDKDELQPGVIYIAPPDYHVLIEKNGDLTLDDSEKVNFSRPSIDVTFESAADACGRSLVCILLSGANADGAVGLRRVKEKGGTVVVQDPETAEFPFMPRKAMENVEVDLVLKTDNVSRIVDFL